ncbi:MAG: hypothetical protein NTW64_01955 [Candidatus Omnitrophica bacterium]|nr:hypothetical protein [Candidatus Omnitrophota bacterium]
MFNRKGQNIAEYSILIALVIAAAVAMQVYVKRGIQGKVADAVDHAPDVAISGVGTLDFRTPQYEPYYVQSAGNVSSNRDVTENITANGGVQRNIGRELTTREAGATENTTWNGEAAR